MKKRVLILVGLLCLTGIAYAGVSTNYDLSWHVIGGGGGRAMDSASYALRSTIGQIIGSSDSDNYGMEAGYWYGAVSTTTPQIKFDTGSGTYPSISGTHNGTIKPRQAITVSKLYTYPCTGTGGHSEHVAFYNATTGSEIANGTWNGYQGAGDYQYIEFEKSFTLEEEVTYDYTIRTGSYPQIIHNQTHTNAYGTMSCTEFVDANGRTYNTWIPAIRLE